MILADHTIKEFLDSQKLCIDPIDSYSIQPASVDCRLGNVFLTTDDTRMQVISLNRKIIYKKRTTSRITIPPHSFVLATTKEYFKLPNDLIAFVEGRSSIGRMGLFIQNAGWVDPGFEGRITLELYNANSLPIRLEANRRICQLVFCRMNSPSRLPYSGKYQKQNTVTGSHIFMDTDSRLNNQSKQT